MNKYILTAACGLAFSAASAQTKALPDSPNILLILVDDLGYGDLSCQGAAKDIQTPHIDKLLNEGVRFTNFHANCPVSSPSSFLINRSLSGYGRRTGSYSYA